MSYRLDSGINARTGRYEWSDNTRQWGWSLAAAVDRLQPGPARGEAAWGPTLIPEPRWSGAREPRGARALDLSLQALR